ncbi:protein FAM83F-like [Chanos chanos]|uniref:Protein FAM83F-like n=1 Tax=Chanos chanos TaxID=29144 RepID=A0A6J2W407_CHACN|nr:protein FAM83F-like [Chanos chanos]
MAESQLICMDDEHVNEKIPESKPEFYYSEEQRAALEQLLKNGDGAFKMQLKDDNAKDFLSAKEITWFRDTFQEYEKESDSESCVSPSPHDSNTDSGVHSTYWPAMSDTEVPPLDLGWPPTGFYKGVTRVSVYTHPPKENSPHIKEVVRRLIQESYKVVAVVMDLLTDLQILQDLLDATSKRGVAVYILLDDTGVPHFLDMCNRLQITAQHLRNLRVRSLRGSGLALSFGKLPGSLCSKYMLVDGEKVMFGSYSFTWSSSRMNRNTITVMSGQVVDFYDNDFRELYAVSNKVDLYREFNISKPPMAVPKLKTPASSAKSPEVSRFQVSVGDSKKTDFKVPAHKYHNPKYALVVGSGMPYSGSLQDLSVLRENMRQNSAEIVKNLLQANGGSNVQSNGVLPQADASTVDTEEDKGESKKPAFGLKKQRSSFRNFLKSRSPNQIQEAKTANHSPDSKATNQNQDAKKVNNSPDSNGTNQNQNTKKPTHGPDSNTTSLRPDTTTVNHSKDTKNEEKAVINKHLSTQKISEDDNTSEVEDSFDLTEKPLAVKFHAKKSKLGQRSLSLQAINTDTENGARGRRKTSKKNCVQS